jgi:Na+-driven multidrug efflux pump
MEKHQRVAGKIQQVLAVLFFFGSLAAIVLIFVLGSINIAGYSSFRAPDIGEYLASPFVLGLAALACVFALQFHWARSWLRGNPSAKYPLVVLAVLQLFYLFLMPIAIYCLWAFLRRLPAEQG